MTSQPEHEPRERPEATEDHDDDAATDGEARDGEDSTDGMPSWPLFDLLGQERR